MAGFEVTPEGNYGACNIHEAHAAANRNFGRRCSRGNRWQLSHNYRIGFPNTTQVSESLRERLEEAEGRTPSGIRSRAGKNRKVVPTVNTDDGSHRKESLRSMGRIFREGQDGITGLCRDLSIIRQRWAERDLGKWVPTKIPGCDSCAETARTGRLEKA